MVLDGFVLIYAWLFQPFIEYGFMRRALVACVAIGLACGPIGTILVLRRMSLAGDAIAHAVLPGAAVGFIFFGLSLPAMTIGSFVAAALMALLAAAVTRWTAQKEDASFASFYLITLALGVMLISTSGSKVDLLHFLFGSVLAIDGESLLLIGGASSFTLIGLAIIWRPLIVECFDPIFFALSGRARRFSASTLYVDGSADFGVCVSSAGHTHGGWPFNVASDCGAVLVCRCCGQSAVGRRAWRVEWCGWVAHFLPRQCAIRARHCFVCRRAVCDFTLFGYARESSPCLVSNAST
jgi:ABC-type Mn2+/Zn2+ transport system permease subunit